MADPQLTSTATVVGGQHHLFVAPFGTTLPTDVGTAIGQGLDDAFVDCGYTADSGTQFKVDAQTKDLFASQSLDPIRTLATSRKATIEAPLIEWNERSVTSAFGGEVTTTANGYKLVPAGSGELVEVTAVLDIEDGDQLYRILIERAISIGSVSGTFAKADFATLPVVLNALAPVTLDTAWEFYSTNDALAPAS